MNKRNIIILSMMALAVLTRLLPHPPNNAMAVIGATFGGCGNNLVSTANAIIDNIIIFLLFIFY
jgi:hypothetical protein